MLFYPIPQSLGCAPYVARITLARKFINDGTFLFGRNAILLNGWKGSPSAVNNPRIDSKETIGYGLPRGTDWSTIPVLCLRFSDWPISIHNWVYIFPSCFFGTYSDVLCSEECQTKKLLVNCKMFAFFKAIFKFCTAKKLFTKQSLTKIIKLTSFMHLVYDVINVIGSSTRFCYSFHVGTRLSYLSTANHDTEENLLCKESSCYAEILHILTRCTLKRKSHLT